MHVMLEAPLIARQDMSNANAHLAQVKYPGQTQGLRSPTGLGLIVNASRCPPLPSLF